MFIASCFGGLVVNKVRRLRIGGYLELILQ